MKLHFLCGLACGEVLPLCLASMTASDCLVLAGETAAALDGLEQCPGQVLLLSEAAPSASAATVDAAGFAALCTRSDRIICW